MSTVSLSDVLKRVAADAMLEERASQVLRDVEQEPLMSGVCSTPQSPKYHAEGPTVRHHLRTMLAGLFAVLEGKVKLLEVEEFASLKGYDDEIQEMENTLKENAATFEVFCLVHDVGKQFRVEKGKDGELHYYGHDKDIYRPDVQALLAHLAKSYRLSDRDVSMIVAMVSNHLEPLGRFKTSFEPKHVDLLTKYATKYGLDADDYIDMLQAGVLLDQVFGSRLASGTSDPVPLLNFFRAEHEYAPWKLQQKQIDAEREKKRLIQDIFHDVGLDGQAVMKLTGMKPSKELGRFLKALQAAIVNEDELPKMGASWQDEVARRADDARQKIATL